MTVQLFIPCYVDQFAPQVAHSLCKLLDNLKIPWHYPTSQTCCGQFAFNSGDWHSASLLMQHFFQVFSGDDIIICPSASCVLTIRHHYPKLVESSTDTANLQRLQPLVFDFTEWLFSQLPLPVSLIWPGRVFLHHSCAARQLGILTKLQHLLSLVGNLQIAEISPAYSCCGFGGLFSLKRPHLSQAIGSNYLKTMFSTNPTAFVSPDVGCLLHLQGILRATGQTFPMYHTAELICQSVKVSESAFSPEPFSSS